MFGNLVPGCCLGDDGCGGQVQLSERTWWCVPQSYDQAAQALSQVLARHAACISPAEAAGLTTATSADAGPARSCQVGTTG